MRAAPLLYSAGMTGKKKPPAGEDDGMALFREAIQDVVPLHHDRTEPFRRRRRPEPAAPGPAPRGEAREELPADMAVETPEELLFMRPGVQQRVVRELRRGRIPPADCLDLHGLRVKQARPVFARFLRQARQRHLRCVRIIHGKGRDPSGTQPVLKQKTHQWLLQRPEVLAFCSAPRFDGGTGATYVLLSRKKANQ